MRSYKLLTSFLLTIVLIFSLFIPNASADGKLIKDPALEEALIEVLDVENLTQSKLEELESLDIGQSNSYTITDLTGLENAKNLSSLYITGHKYSDVTPISKLNKLTSLALYDNSNLKNIEPLSKLTNLTDLFLDNLPNLKDIQPLSKLTNLTFLTLNSNGLENIDPISSLTNLDILLLVDNNISSIDSLSKLKNLGYLEIAHNNIKDISPIKNLTNLVLLNLSDNEIEQINDLSSLTELKSLHLENNNLTSIEGVPTDNLVYLNVYDNQLTSLDGLQVKDDVYYYFEFGWNQISDIRALSGIKKGYIDLSENNISDISPLKDMEEGRVILYGNNLNEQSKIMIKDLNSRGVSVHLIPTDNKRIAGASRYHTAVEISKKGWKVGSTDTVVIARGDSFPDALAGATLAYEKNAPILLTGETLHEVTIEEIKRLSADKAIVLGGPSAVPDKVVDQLEELGIVVERVAGSGRYETAVDVAEKLTSNADTAILAYGLDFPDALAIAPYAAEHGYPILLTDKDKLPNATKQYLAENQEVKNIIIVGGTGVISENIANQLEEYQIERIAGQHRYDTAAKIAAKFGTPSKAYIANGNSFADALTGAVLAAKEGAPLLLVETDKLPSATQNVIKNIDTFTFLGGETVITERLKNQILK